MFHFPGSASRLRVGIIRHNSDWVSPFGNLRIKGCLAPPRSLSQQRHVLHRHFVSRHPPYALKFPVKKFENHTSPEASRGKPLHFSAKCVLHSSQGERRRTCLSLKISDVSLL